MRGDEVRSGSLFSYVDLEAPRSHPLRTIRGIVDAALTRLDGDFAADLCNDRLAVDPIGAACGR